MDLRLQLRLRKDQRGVPHLKPPLKPAPKPLIPVACGVLVDAAGNVLVAQRPPGKVAAGKWEFPGGKIEPGETALQALARELREELGVEVRGARRLIRFTHEYSDRRVVLDTWLIDRYAGRPESREGQAFCWMQPSVLTELDVLPTVKPALAALRLPPHYVFTPPDATAEFLLSGLARLPRGALLRLRQPGLSDEDYRRLAARLVPPCRDCGIGLMLDRAPEQVAELNAAGWHVAQARLDALETHAVKKPQGWIAVSVHDVAALARAARAGADFAVLGPLRETATHPGTAGIGWAAFEHIAGTSALPVYAIGGLGPADLDEARTHRAQGIAAIRAYWSDSGVSGEESALSSFSSGTA
jgi:8-oxo-dGTP diphosphatase